MMFIIRKLKKVAYFKLSDPATLSAISRKESGLNFIDVVTWKNPILTWNVLLIFHILFWIIVKVELKFYSIIFISFLVAFICGNYLDRKKWNAQSGEVVNTSKKNINKTFCEVFKCLHFLRKEHKNVLSVSMCIGWSIIGCVSKHLTGYVFTYLLILNIFFGPTIFSTLPPKCKKVFKDIFHMIISTEVMVTENELLPSAINKDVERIINLDEFNDDKMSDSVTNSFASGISSMPSYLDAENSLDDIEDLEYPLRSSHTSVDTYLNNLNDLDSECTSTHFESLCFTHDESSEEDNFFAEDLNFTVTDTDLKTSECRSYNLRTFFSNLPISSGLINNVAVAANTANQKISSSESDFEMITDDEIEEQ